MMTLVYLIFIGLLSRTSGQVPVVSFSKPYVNKSETVTITCTVVTVSDTVVISKDGINLFRCLSLPIPCTTLDPVAAAYVAVKNMSAGTTAVTIGVSSISRDTGNWTCLYGAASKSTPVSLAVVAPSSSTRLIEEPGYIILELNCTYPNRSLGLTFYLGAKMYTEGSLEESSVPCDDYEASLNYTLKFPSQHSNSYDGIFNVFYNNGFYVARISGTRHYTFSSGENHCPDEFQIAVCIGLAIIILDSILRIVLHKVKGDQFVQGLGICSVLEIIGCIISIVVLALKGYQLKLGLGICFGIIILACIIRIIILGFVKNGDFLRLGHCICSVIIIIVCISCIVILVKNGEECPQRFLIGFGVGFGILIIVCIIYILILIFFKKVIIQNKHISPRTDDKEVTITAIIYGLCISVEWFKEKTPLENNGDFKIEPYDNKTRKSSLIIKSSSMTNSATYICRAKNLCGCCSAEDSITLPHDKDKQQPGKSVPV